MFDQLYTRNGCCVNCVRGKDSTILVPVVFPVQPLFSTAALYWGLVVRGYHSKVWNRVTERETFSHSQKHRDISSLLLPALIIACVYSFFSLQGCANNRIASSHLNPRRLLLQAYRRRRTPSATRQCNKKRWLGPAAS